MRANRSSESGMTLIGVVMAFTILALVIGPAAFLVAQTTIISGQTRSQVVASNLAQASLSTVQSESEYDFSQLANNIGTTTSRSTVGGIAYTVSTDVSWQEPDTGSTGGTCGTSSATGALDPLLYATATVTWANIGATPPVSITSSYHPPSSYFNPDDGTVVIDIKNQAGQPQPGITVALGQETEGPSAVTNTNGCVVFPNLAPADNWYDALEGPTNETFVNRVGSTTPYHYGLQITAGQTSDYTQYYAEAATVTYTGPASPSGIVVPWALGLTLGSPGLPGDESDYLNAMGDVVTPGGGTLTNVFPTPDSYALAIGTCVPFVDYASDVNPTVAVTPGGTSNGAIVGTPVTITVDSSTTPVSGAEISITSTTAADVTDTDCEGGASGATATDSDFTTTDSTGTVTILAPFGSFTVTATSGSQSATSTVETPTPESPTDVTLTL